MKASITSRSPIRRTNSRSLRLPRHPIGDRLQGRQIDARAPDIDNGELRHRLAAAHDANRLAGSGLRDQFAQMCVSFGEIDLPHNSILAVNTNPHIAIIKAAGDPGTT